MPVLAIVPTRVIRDHDAELLLRCLVSLGATAPDVPVLVVADPASGRRLAEPVAAAVAELGHEHVGQPAPGGLAAAVNLGLDRAREAGSDALVVHPEVQFLEPGWLEALLVQEDTRGRPAAVVGGRLLSPDGLIVNAGYYFSLLRRVFSARFNSAPAELPEALVPAALPVSGALQLIRHDALQALGGYDEGIGRGVEDVHYCLRAFAAGLECAYAPKAAAIHIDAGFRRRAMDVADLPTFARLVAAHPPSELARFAVGVP